MVALPAAMPPRVADARLPASYEQAKAALANCAALDECMDWANKAEALASYARQADDDTLRKMADRIQARAVRRCGELLKLLNAPGARTDQPRGSAPPRSASEAARDAGLSRDQHRTAIRVANIPEPTFERHVESDMPPSVTRLADMGIRRPEAPPNMARATHAWGTLRRFAEWCDLNVPEEIAQGIYPHEVADMRTVVSTIDGWLDRFVVNLKE